MSLALILLIALTTYSSRALALVLMPQPPERVRVILDRIPAPLFASLAVTSLVVDRSPASPETFCAAAGALALVRTRSLLVVLLGGFAGYAIGSLVF